MADYLMFCSLLFFISGISLFIYVVAGGYGVLNLAWYNDPFFYLGIGLTCFVLFILQRRYKFFDGLVKYDE